MEGVRIFPVNTDITIVRKKIESDLKCTLDKLVELNKSDCYLANLRKDG